MNLHFPHILASVKALSCLFILVGLGWTFAEVRRFVLHGDEFYAEAMDDRSHGRTISLICGALYLLIGAVAAYDVFGRRGLGPSFQSPYVLGEGSEVRSFVTVFGSGAAVWGIFSAAATRFLPPPLFGEETTQFLCRIVRGSLFTLWLAALVYALPHIGDNKTADAVGGVIGVIALSEIATGEIWSYRTVGWWWSVPPLTCEERPFPYVASNLVSIAFAFLFLIA
jgi:hypothetical protein